MAGAARPGARAPQELVLSPELRDAIIAHAREASPNEACGLIPGHGRVSTRIIPCANTHPQPTTKYRIDPRQQLRAFQDMEAKGEELVAIYHSHPASQPYPSPTDRSESHYPDAVYVLVSLRSQTPEVRAFRIVDDMVREIALP